MKTTPLYTTHVTLGARMAPFGGYLMPIQYKNGILFEHNATRRHAAIFDTCHMGEFQFQGSSALSDLERILSCPVESLKIGQCRYGFLCNESGGVIDDQILFRRGENDFFMVVNASTEAVDFEWISANISPTTIAANISEKTAKIDIQGPVSPRICTKLFDEPIDELKYYHFMTNTYRGERILLGRTGYTGEIGFEVFLHTEGATALWNECLANGVEPAGLGARDILRLEMGYPLYGHELDVNTNASWSGFTKAIGCKQFIGADACNSLSDNPYRLCGLLVNGRRTAHPGNMITSLSGEEIGRITSGSFSPSLGQAIALGYIRSGYHAAGTDTRISTDRGPLTAKVSMLPFYTRATGRDTIKQYLE